MNIVEHGGPDGGALLQYDFSTNANPLGPPPALMHAVMAADRTRYPDPNYAALRERLATWHEVMPQQVLPTAGTSEAIHRLTLVASLRGITEVWLPQPGYGDYRAAASAHRLGMQTYASGEALLQGLADGGGPVMAWLCEPCNPTGESLPTSFWTALIDASSRRPMLLALDRAYEPLRLHGSDPVPPAVARQLWRFASPNKSLGLTGIRAGYLLAPDDDAIGLLPTLQSLAPSWVVSAEGVAMLGELPTPDTQAWLARSRATLTEWGQAQRAALTNRGWQQRPSVTPFWLARPPEPAAALLAHLRRHGVKLRDATSFGLPGWVRISVQPPPSQRALIDALDSFTTPCR